MNDNPNDTMKFDYIKLIAMARIVSLIFNPSEHNITPLTAELMETVLRGLNASPSDAKHLVAMTSTMYKKEAMEVVAKLLPQEKEKIIRVMIGGIPSLYYRRLGIIGQQRFRHICETCGLPWEIIDEMMVAESVKWVYKIGAYCFEDYESALQAGKIIDESERLVRKALGPIAESKESSPIVETLVGEGIHVWSIDEFKDPNKRIAAHLRAYEQRCVQSQVQPSFIADDVSSWLDSMVERKRREWGQ